MFCIPGPAGPARRLAAGLLWRALNAQMLSLVCCACFGPPQLTVGGCFKAFICFYQAHWLCCMAHPAMMRPARSVLNVLGRKLPRACACKHLWAVKPVSRGCVQDGCAK